jgi:hypothetical protein
LVRDDRQAAIEDLRDLVSSLHGPDVAGTKFFETLQEATPIRPRRRMKIVNLGLDPWEAVELAEEGIVDIEDVTYETRQHVAAYVTERDPKWGEWLQTHRVELNAFTMPQFIEWLDKNMSDYTGKLVPPAGVMADRLNDQVRRLWRESIIAQVLSEARVDERVDDALSSVSARMDSVADRLPDRVEEALQGDPQRHWAHVVDELPESLAEGMDV